MIMLLVSSPIKPESGLKGAVDRELGGKYIQFFFSPNFRCLTFCRKTFFLVRALRIHPVQNVLHLKQLHSQQHSHARLYNTRILMHASKLLARVTRSSGPGSNPAPKLSQPRAGRDLSRSGNQ